MTNISPLNEKIVQTRLNAIKKNNKHELAYKDLIVQSADVKPNKAKAVLVKETFPQSVKSYIKDTVQDVKHFFTAAKTGKMDDNSLGRINDLGMKFGGLLIATFLASRAKTKTEGIMQYIGGGAFFASMALWPKLFINLPAKLIHGFKIDQKYISAQGEKKDFFLDNQFLPWDAFSEEELRANAQNAGIDYDSENGDEKIKRKMQKTALQNRTLWMATAGFATPLMTALFGDFIQPKVKKAVIQNGLGKSKSAIANLAGTLNGAKPIVRNTKEINDIIARYQAPNSKMKNQDMLEKLSEQLTLDFKDVFSDSDDTKTITDFKFSIDKSYLETLKNHISTIEDEDISELLKKAVSETSSDKTSAASKLKNFVPGAAKVSKEVDIDADIIKTITERFKSLEHKNQTIKSLADIISEIEKEKQINLSTLRSKLPNISFKFDDSEFFDTVKDLNTDLLGVLRGRAKQYLEVIVNPVIGSKDESIYTDIYRDAMKKALPKTTKWIDTVKFDFLDKGIFKPIRKLKPVLERTVQKISQNPKSLIGKIKVLDTDSLKLIKSSSKALEYEGGISRFYSVSAEAMSKMYQEIASIENEEEYKEAIEKLVTKNNGKLGEYVTKITSGDMLKEIFPEKLPLNEGVTDGLKGKFTDSISRAVGIYKDIANANNTAIRSRALVSINLERRIKNKEFEHALQEAGLISKENTLESLIQKARYMVYRGTVASDACQMEFKNENLYKKLTEILYDSKYYSAEKEAFSGLEETLNALRYLGTKSKDNAYATALAKLEASFVTDIVNNRAWKKIFIPMAACLVGITLLVQPFFGNIKKEFPEKKEGGN